MMTGADTIDDVDLRRVGGTPRVFGEVYAPSTAGIFLRESTFGHTNQLAAVARRNPDHTRATHPALLPGIDERAFLDIDSVYGHDMQGASFGHEKIAGRAPLRKGPSPQVTVLSTPDAAPVITEMRLGSGKTGSGAAPPPR